MIGLKRNTKPPKNGIARSTTLVNMYQAPIGLGEDRVFPAAEAELPEAALRAIGQSMASRRVFPGRLFALPQSESSRLRR